MHRMVGITRNKRRALAPTALGLVAVLFAASLSAPAAAEPGVRDANTANTNGNCSHPHPCGDEWPNGLEGPFERGQVTSVTVKSFDGTELSGWIALPQLPEGVRAPVLLHTTPYLGDCDLVAATCRRTPEDPSWFSDDLDGGAGSPIYHWGVRPIDLIRHGYAMASFSVRGTGRSGGCVDTFGAKEQGDQVALIEWLAAQEWSNGRVAMGGISYPAATAWEGAIHAPPALKTIVTAGIVSDHYSLVHTPQGAALTLPAGGTGPQNPLLPPLGGLQHSPDPVDSVAHHAKVVPQRLCGLTSPLRGLTGYATDMRDEAFYSERRLIDGFSNVTAAVLLAQGFGDLGHGYQDSLVWESLDNAPKRQVVGWWGHDFPYGNDYPIERYRVELDQSWEHAQWRSLLLAWLDYWLKGIGEPPRLGKADYQDTAGLWHESSSWPPKEAKNEVLYLGHDALTPHPEVSSETFRAGPNIQNSYKGATGVDFPWRPWSALCPDAATSTAGTAGVVYLSGALDEKTLIAGNPFAYLTLSSDAPGGIVTVDLVELGPDFMCDATGQPKGLRPLALGAADLRFNEGNFVGRDFPVATPTHVRIDLTDLAASIEKDHQLAVVVSYGETHHDYSSAQPYFPKITILGSEDISSSHLVLPVVEGSLGGKKPKLDYPTRPFAPEE